MAKAVKVTSYKKQVLAELNRKVPIVLDFIGTRAEGFAQGDCPVDTGRLRNSISHKVKGDAVYVGSNVVYAKQVEYNDRARHKTGKAHFLRDAVTNHGDEYKAITEAALKD